ncbi:MAG: leucyl aminopeptidase [Candidatus Omnitrophica bacterium]|nr:leucyl aminopeptidase [Candidatus Omnitrophota bacterium]
MITFRTSIQFDKPVTVILVDKDQIKSKKFLFTNKVLKYQIAALAQSDQFSGEDGQIFPLLLSNTIALLVGIGDPKELSLTALCVTVRKALLSSSINKVKELEIILPKDDKTVKVVIEAVLIGAYSWKKYRTKTKEDKSIDITDKKVFIAAEKKKIYQDAIKVCEGVNLTRDLVNDNADTVTSDHIEKVIRSLVAGKKNISLAILNKKEMKAKKLGLHLAVNQGSKKEPKLIIVKYNGSSKKGDYTAFIGKGITFDTGGLNIKPSGHMETMRMDMGGTAAVIGTLKNTIALNLKKNVLFVCALAENAIGSGSYKPGDVIRGYSGKTVEVANTDAEGRLVLADAIAYVVKNYKPARIIDIATLTGACVVALGNDYTGLMTTDDQFSRALVRSSNETDDRAWRLPIYPELKEAVKSKIADIRNLGYPKGAAGTITAAEFLHQFTDGTTWAHLDIAGTAFDEGQGRMYFGPGATGAGVRLVTHYLENN